MASEDKLSTPEDAHGSVSFQPVRLAYDKFEPNGGAEENLAPIIFLHGATASKEYWGDLPQIMADATKRKAYAIDARNHGDSEWSDHWNFDVNSDDMMHFMDSRNIQKAIFVGHSMGGMISIRIALTKPERVEKVIVEDMTVRKIPKEILSSVSLFLKVIELVPPDVDEDEAKQIIMENNLKYLPPEFKNMIKQNSASKIKHCIALRRDANGRYQYKANMEVLARVLCGPEDIMEEPRGKYGGPALFIYGKLSPFMVGANEDHIKQFFPNVVMKGIEDAAHSVYMDKPEEYIDELIKFIFYQPVRLAYNKFEPKTGKDKNLAPIIYLHGSTVCKEYWNDIPQIVADATKREAYTIDFRNHGDSEWSDQWNFDIYVDDLIHFMDSHGIQKAILVGHSMGGSTAIKTALKKPQSIEKVVIEDMPVQRLPKDILISIQEYVSTIQKGIELVPSDADEDKAKEIILDYNLKHLPPHFEKMRSANTAAYKSGIALRRDANGLYHYKANIDVIFKGYTNPEQFVTESRGKYEGPALFIYGKLSPFKVEDDDQIKHLFPNAVLKGIEDAGHSVHTNKPTEFTDELMKFIIAK